MDKLPFKKKNILEVEFTECPRHIKDLIAKKEAFRNDVRIKHCSEMDPFDENKTYGDTLSMAHIESYWKDQCETNNYKGDLDLFIKEYNLEIDKWFIETGYDFTGVTEIIFNISW